MVKDIECATCTKVFDCKGKPDIDVSCINYEERPPIRNGKYIIRKDDEKAGGKNDD